MNKFLDNPLEANQEDFQIGETKCPQCGGYFRYLKPLHMIDYKIEYDDLKKRHNHLFSHLNTLIGFCEKEYGLNPSKDLLVKQLVDLREMFED